MAITRRHLLQGSAVAAMAHVIDAVAAERGKLDLRNGAAQHELFGAKESLALHLMGDFRGCETSPGFKPEGELPLLICTNGFADCGTKLHISRRVPRALRRSATREPHRDTPGSPSTTC